DPARIELAASTMPLSRAPNYTLGPLYPASFKARSRSSENSESIARRLCAYSHNKSCAVGSFTLRGTLPGGQVGYLSDWNLPLTMCAPILDDACPSPMPIHAHWNKVWTAAIYNPDPDDRAALHELRIVEGVCALVDQAAYIEAEDQISWRLQILDTCV